MSYSICKADFYYGAFLSVITNNGIRPVIVEVGNKRNIYDISTNKDDYRVYTKYVVNSNPNDSLWNVIFTTSEVEEISKFINTYDKLLFAIICTYKDIKSNNTEIAILDIEDLKKCIDLNCKMNKNLRLSIRKVKHSPNLHVYGTHRSDKKYGKDNTIKISRRRILEL